MSDLPDLVSAAEDSRALATLNRWLENQNAEDRVAWALKCLPGPHVLSSSFGAQSAVSLHLISRQYREVPVILIDTGYLFEETYRFADELTERLDLDLRVYQPKIGRTWMEARHGRLWEHGLEGLNRYDDLRKVEPLRRALEDLAARTWFAGLRRSQASTREHINVLELKHGRWKVHPLIDWSDNAIWQYLSRHALPYHPLWHEGYVSIGDVHTTRRWQHGMRKEDTRYFGLKRECGIHLEV